MFPESAVFTAVEVIAPVPEITALTVTNDAFVCVKFNVALFVIFPPTFPLVPPNVKIPALMVVIPVAVFIADSVQVPASCFVSIPVPVPRILAKVPLYDPPSVKP